MASRYSTFSRPRFEVRRRPKANYISDFGGFVLLGSSREGLVGLLGSRRKLLEMDLAEDTASLSEAGGTAYRKPAVFRVICDSEGDCAILLGLHSWVCS